LYKQASPAKALATTELFIYKPPLKHYPFKKKIL